MEKKPRSWSQKTMGLTHSLVSKSPKWTLPMCNLQNGVLSTLKLSPHCSKWERGHLIRSWLLKKKVLPFKNEKANWEFGLSLGNLEVNFKQALLSLNRNNGLYIKIGSISSETKFFVQNITFEIKLQEKTTRMAKCCGKTHWIWLRLQWRFLWIQTVTAYFWPISRLSCEKL